MVIRNRFRQVLVLALLAGYYAVQAPTAAVTMSEECASICQPWTYCGTGCSDEINYTYTYCQEYTGGNCDPTYPLCSWPYSPEAWTETGRVQMGRKTLPKWGGFYAGCYLFYRVTAVSACGLGERDFCERVEVDLDYCEQIGWGDTCYSSGLDCYPGNTEDCE